MFSLLKRPDALAETIRVGHHVARLPRETPSLFEGDGVELFRSDEGVELLALLVQLALLFDDSELMGFHKFNSKAGGALGDYPQQAHIRFCDLIHTQGATPDSPACASYVSTLG